MSSTPGSLALGPASPALQPEVVALLRACGLPVDDLSPDLDGFMLATAAGEIVGCVAVDSLGNSVGLLRSLAVRADWRGRGMARLLFDAAVARAKRLGFSELFLLTTTAEGMFARWGFTALSRDSAPAPVQATAEFRDLCPSSAVVMQMRVEPGPRVG
jgi:N-acetylglutamate synthase-like GNAT family acetyltransferase